MNARQRIVKQFTAMDSLHRESWIAQIRMSIEVAEEAIEMWPQSPHSETLRQTMAKDVNLLEELEAIE